MTAPGRVLATVLFTDIVGSTARASAMGDGAWRELLDRHDTLLRAIFDKQGCREIQSRGDGFLVAFDTPTTGVQAAVEAMAAATDLGIDIRAGVHTGECELRSGAIDGIAVHLAARITDEAGAGEILVSATVRDLMTGSGIAFTSRGTRSFKGVPGEWEVFAAAGSGPLSDTTISIMLVDDHPLWRSTLKSVLEGKRVGTIVAEASSGEEASELLASINPDIVMMDMHLPGESGAATTARLVATYPGIKILMLSGSTEAEDVRAAMRAGAVGYVVKTAGPEEIASAVARAVAGELVVPASVADIVRRDLSGN